MNATRTLAGLGLTKMPNLGAPADPDTPIVGLAVDSRKVAGGFVFAAIPGTELDGATFAQYAVRQGAVAIIGTEDGAETVRADLGGLPVPFFATAQPRLALAHLAARFYPRQPGVMAAVTGTNGKTSVSQFLQQIWACADLRAAALGTAGITGEGFVGEVSHTTPEPIALHVLLDSLAGQGCTHGAMEASSHGLAQHRVDGVRLSVGGFTNISRDHMDYHDSHEDYVAAKLRLFAEVMGKDGAAVINADDPVFGRARQTAFAAGLKVVAVGHGVGADLGISVQRYTSQGQVVRFTWAGHQHTLALGLIGSFQAQNAGLAAGMALASGLDEETVFTALPQLRGVRGRMELVARRSNGAAVYVDYAHTPDALATAIDALRPHCTGNLVTVFGAGGDRDPGKRPLMGQAVALRADTAIVTDDNPRGEDPMAIRREVLEGCPEAHEIGDRAAAILAGIDSLKDAGDCLLIAGKGHEQGQEVKGEMLPFDDATQARSSVGALDGLREATGVGR